MNRIEVNLFAWYVIIHSFLSIAVNALGWNKNIPGLLTSTIIISFFVWYYSIKNNTNTNTKQ